MIHKLALNGTKLPTILLLTSSAKPKQVQKLFYVGHSQAQFLNEIIHVHFSLLQLTMCSSVAANVCQNYFAPLNIAQLQACLTRHVNCLVKEHTKTVNHLLSLKEEELASDRSHVLE